MKLKGVDVFVVSNGIPKLSEDWGDFSLKAISNRGTQVWPKTPPIQLTDLFQCRFMLKSNATKASVTALLAQLDQQNITWSHVEKLLEFNGKDGFSGLHAAG